MDSCRLPIENGQSGVVLKVEFQVQVEYLVPCMKIKQKAFKKIKYFKK